jgi:integrase
MADIMQSMAETPTAYETGALRSDGFESQARNPTHKLAAQRTPKVAATLAAGAWLTDAQVRSLAQQPGKHRIGPQVTLVVSRPGRGAGEFRYTLHGRTRYLGLGGWPRVSLAEMRRRVEAADALLAQHIDPLDQKAAERQAAVVAAARSISFADAAERYIALHEAAWRNRVHRKQWRTSLATHAAPIARMPVAEIDAPAVLRVLTSIWVKLPETASRVRGRIEAVLDFARVQGWRPDDGRINPATWKGNLALTLPAKTKVRAVKHHAALDWRDLPAFMAQLCSQDGVSCQALRFAILTAARSGEIRLARWHEIEWDRCIWIVPPDRMKARREHRVPLVPAALDVLRLVAPLRRGDGGLVFPGMKRDAPLSDMSLTAVLRRMGRGAITVHGFRSAFRDWCGETGQPADIAEAALAHVVGDKTVAAYQRGDLLERRRRLMNTWAAYCAGEVEQG